jgi:hypothetical protein
MAGGREEIGRSQFVKGLEQVTGYGLGPRTNRKHVYFCRQEVRARTARGQLHVEFSLLWLEQKELTCELEPKGRYGSLTFARIAGECSGKIKALTICSQLQQ